MFDRTIPRLVGINVTNTVVANTHPESDDYFYGVYSHHGHIRNREYNACEEVDSRAGEVTIQELTDFILDQRSQEVENIADEEKLDEYEAAEKMVDRLDRLGMDQLSGEPR